MTLPHDCEARLRMLGETIERNRDNAGTRAFEEEGETAKSQKQK